MKYKVTVSTVMAGKIVPNDIIEDWESPKFGRYWWFWSPCFNSNGGKFKRGDCVDFSVQWLCLSLGLTFWPQGERTERKGDK